MNACVAEGASRKIAIDHKLNVSMEVHGFSRSLMLGSSLPSHLVSYHRFSKGQQG